MNNYCTLFNGVYFSRFLALYYSLKRVCPSFHLYVLFLDAPRSQFDFLKQYEEITLIDVNDFENEKLLNAKRERTKGEYCWTCTASLLDYCLKTFELSRCTYLDADLYFFSDPSTLLEEGAESSILITEHRYTHKYDQTKLSGKYCVQFVSIKNDKNGIGCLEWWRDACLEWCYAKPENGKFGDQKYLDDWSTRFSGVHELNHLGGGVAPWNVQQYEISSFNNKIFGRPLAANERFKLVFFHFHGVRFYENGYVDFGHYELNQLTVKFIYEPYLQELMEIHRSLENQGIELTHESLKKSKQPLAFLKQVKRKILKNYNLYKLSSLYGNNN